MLLNQLEAHDTGGCRSYAKMFGQSTRKIKFPFDYLHNKHKLMKTVRERSILAVPIARNGPLREPIRMLLFIMYQFSHIITMIGVYWATGTALFSKDSSSICKRKR